MSPAPVLLSALGGQGIDALKTATARILERHCRRVRIIVPTAEGRVIPWICRHGRLVENAEARDGGQNVLAQLDAQALGSLREAFPALDVAIVNAGEQGLEFGQLVR